MSAKNDVRQYISMPKATKVHTNTKLRMFDPYFAKDRQICAVEGCSRCGLYSTFIGDGPYCFGHRPSNAFPLGTVLCGAATCINIATRGLSKYGLPIFCMAHRQPGNVISIGRLCNATGCKERAIWRFHHCKPSKCDKHRYKYMVKNLYICCYDGCTEPTITRGQGKNRSRYCHIHRYETGTDNLNAPEHSKCSYPGCRKVPLFMSDDKTMGCRKHKISGMLPMERLRCAYPGCQKFKNYGRKGEKKMFCGEHKAPGMEKSG